MMNTKIDDNTPNVNENFTTRTTHTRQPPNNLSISNSSLSSRSSSNCAECNQININSRNTNAENNHKNVCNGESEKIEGTYDELTKLDEVLLKTNINDLNVDNSKNSNNFFLLNRNSFYFRSKINNYNHTNKLKDIKTINLIPSFNYFFLKPKKLPPGSTTPNSNAKPAVQINNNNNNIINNVNNNNNINNNINNNNNDNSIYRKHNPMTNMSLNRSRVAQKTAPNSNQSITATAADLLSDDKKSDLISILNQISLHIYKLQSFDFKNQASPTQHGGGLISKSGSKRMTKKLSRKSKTRLMHRKAISESDLTASKSVDPKEEKAGKISRKQTTDKKLLVGAGYVNPRRPNKIKLFKVNFSLSNFLKRITSLGLCKSNLLASNTSSQINRKNQNRINTNFEKKRSKSLNDLNTYRLTTNNLNNNNNNIIKTLNRISKKSKDKGYFLNYKQSKLVCNFINDLDLIEKAEPIEKVQEGSTEATVKLCRQLMNNSFLNNSSLSFNSDDCDLTNNECNNNDTILNEVRSFRSLSGSSIKSLQKANEFINCSKCKISSSDAIRPLTDKSPFEEKNIIKLKYIVSDLKSNKKKEKKLKNKTNNNKKSKNKNDDINLNNISSKTRKRHQSDTAIMKFNQVNLVDLRSFEEKKSEINDKVLNVFLGSNRARRRDAICSKIDKIYNNRQLINYMEYLLREDYIRNFLL